MDVGVSPSMHGGPSHSYVQPSGSIGDVLPTGPGPGHGQGQGPRARDTMIMTIALADMREETVGTESWFDGIEGGRFSISCSEPELEGSSVARYSTEAERTNGTDYARECFEISDSGLSSTTRTRTRVRCILCGRCPALSVVRA